MRNLLLAIALAAPASAEPFRYVSFREIQAASVEARVAEAKRLKEIVIQFFADPEDDGDRYIRWEGATISCPADEATKAAVRRLPFLAVGETVVPAKDVLWRYNQAAAAFYDSLVELAALDNANVDLKALADWGHNTWVHSDDAIELHSSRLISSSEYDELKLK